jgi:hypothetical protein
MNNDKSLEKKPDDKEMIEQPEEAGKKAIEAGKKFDPEENSPEETEEKEKKDAEKWRNEG